MVFVMIYRKLGFINVNIKRHFLIVNPFSLQFQAEVDKNFLLGVRGGAEIYTTERVVWFRNLKTIEGNDNEYQKTAWNKFEYDGVGNFSIATSCGYQ